jgi:S1-C subfamily serine protease
MPLLVAILLISNIGVVAYMTVHQNQQVEELNGQIGTLTATVQTLDAEIGSVNAELSSLRNAIESGAINVTVTTGPMDAILIELYNKTRESVVLIRSTVPDGVGQGSGFIFDVSGHIVTNFHVVEDALSVTVTFIDGTIFDAEIIGTDPYSDVAVIRIDAPISILKPLPLGDSSKLKVGESVVAIGNPYGLANTLTSGIISATGRQMDSAGNYPIVDVIQMDAAINPGNSGGPLMNLKGEVVGINTAIPSETSRGIGFAVPSNTIVRELPSLLTDGTYVHPYLGITGLDLTPSLVETMNLPVGTHGTLVSSVTVPSPANSAGIRGSTRTVTIDGEQVSVGGDVILGADGTLMKSFYDLILYIQRNKKPGDDITLNILRDAAEIDVVVRLGARPPPT